MTSGRCYEAIALAAVLCGCGEPPRSDDAVPGGTAPPSETSSTSTGGSSLGESSSSTGLLDLPDEGPVACVECAIELYSKQSGALVLGPAETLGHAVLGENIVYTLGTFGAGHYIVTADNSLVLTEETDCPLLQWLARTTAPRVLVFGRGEEVELLGTTHPPGIHLPAQYIGDPQALRTDFDLVIYFEDTAHLYEDDPSDEELQTVLAYLEDGGGVIASSEYVNGVAGYLTPADVESVNRLLNPLGIEALGVSLNWGDVGGHVEFPCFPPAG